MAVISVKNSGGERKLKRHRLFNRRRISDAEIAFGFFVKQLDQNLTSFDRFIEWYNRYMKRNKLYILFVFLIINVSACSMFSPNLKREVLKDDMIRPGNYTLILYGARYGEDLETIAFLDYEGDDVVFEPFARADDYEIKYHVGDGEALTEATKFISWYPSFVSSQLSRITDTQGRVLGYELRPRYLRILTYGHSDVLRVRYSLKDKKVIIYVSLKEEVERAIDGNGADESEFEK